MIYKNILKSLRENNELSQSKMGAIIGVDNKAYQHFESEYTIIPLKHLITYASYFNVSIDYFFEFTLTRNYSNINKNIDLKLIGNRLKEFRKDNKLTQDKLANVLKVNRSTISKYEKGINLIATPFLYTICKKYKISADYLLGKIDSPKYLN